MKIRPMPGKIVLRMLEPAKSTIGGLVLPDTAQQQMPFGVVVDAGEPPAWFTNAGYTLESFIGSTVVLPGFAGRTVELPDRTKVRIVDYADVWCYVDEESATVIDPDESTAKPGGVS